MITIKNHKTIELHNVPTAYASAIKRRLMLADPSYYKMKAMGTPMYGKDEFFRYYKTKGDALVVPKGFRAKLLRFLDKNNLAYEEITKKVDKKRTDAIAGEIELRDYQVPILAMMQEKGGGVVQMSTGSGKSIVALEYAIKSGLCATIIVKDKTLLHQMVSECEKFWGYKPGVVGDGKKQIKDITVATVQTLQSDEFVLETLSRQTGVLIVDEIQEFVTNARVDIIESFAPTNFFGLTATPYRSDDDGRTGAIEIIFGETITQYVMKQMAPKVRVYCTGFNDIPVRAKYSDMIEGMIHHEKRNRFIAGIAGGEIYSGKKVLILTKRVLHSQMLYDIIRDIGGVYLIEKDTKGKADILKGLKDGSLPYSCIIGTASLLGTGFDVPTLDRLFIAGDMKSNVLTVQSVGRILRLLNGKDPEVIDFCDDKNPMLKNQFRARKKVYTTNRWDIIYHPEYMQKWL